VNKKNLTVLQNNDHGPINYYLPVIPKSGSTNRLLVLHSHFSFVTMVTIEYKLPILAMIWLKNCSICVK